MIEIQKLYKECKINEKPKNIQDILDFFNLNKHILNLKGDKLENELATKWTFNKFKNLLECVYSLSKHNFEIYITKNELNEISELIDTFYQIESVNGKKLDKNDSIYYENLKSLYKAKEYEYSLNTINLLNNENSDNINEIRKTIFEKNTFEEIINKFIIPKSMIKKEIDYGYNKEELRYIANLTLPAEESHLVIERLTDIFSFDYSTSLERKRSMRKKIFELIFTIYLKGDLFELDKKFKEEYLLSFDEILQDERDDNLDKEWGSFHNVLYGFISGKNTYKLSYIGFENKKSHYGFLCVVVEVMNILNNLIVLAQKNIK